MRKRILAIFAICLICAPDVDARTAMRSTITNTSRAGTTNAVPISVNEFVSPTSYETMYPYMNNTMKTEMNPGVTTSYSALPTSLSVRSKTIDTRTVVPRSATTSATNSARSATATYTTPTYTSSARSATPTATTTTSSARSATPSTSTTSSSRRVVARSARPSAEVNVYSTSDTAVNYTVSADTCFADYSSCMDDYCERLDAEYNRCYCSSTLAQIEDEYQPKINNLIMQILTKNGTESTWTEDEMNEYWDEMIGVHVGDNSWENLDELLGNIDWAGTESLVRGQQTFITGHDYCTQHLQACSYMSGNMRDMYKSEIARDCTIYENGLERLENAAIDFLQMYE